MRPLQRRAFLVTSCLCLCTSGLEMRPLQRRAFVVTSCLCLSTFQLLKCTILLETPRCYVTTILEIPCVSNVFFLQERWQPMDFPCCHLEVSLASLYRTCKCLHCNCNTNTQLCIVCVYMYVQANKGRLSSVFTCTYHVQVSNMPAYSLPYYSVCVALHTGIVIGVEFKGRLRHQMHLHLQFACYKTVL